MNKPKYWLYRHGNIPFRGDYLQAKLETPIEHDDNRLCHFKQGDKTFTIKSPAQVESFGKEFELTYSINPNHPTPDYYPESYSFDLYSERLINLVDKFGVKFEHFPVKLIDKKGKPINNLKYNIFHFMEDVVDGMDQEKSEWVGDFHIGIPRLVLDYNKFEHRPMILLDHLYIRLIRDDLKQEIIKLGITGFGFLDPLKYRSGKYGFPPNFED